MDLIEVNPTRRRALLAHTEEQKEAQVRARQLHAENAEQWTREAACALYALLTDGGGNRATLLDVDTAEVLERVGAFAEDWNTGDEQNERWFHFRVDGDFVLRYTHPHGDRGRFAVIGWCPTCGDILTYGYSIDRLAELGAALDAEDKGPALHTCYRERVMEEYMPDTIDPATTLLTALEDYIDARLRGAGVIPNPDDSF